MTPKPSRDEERECKHEWTGQRTGGKVPSGPGSSADHGMGNGWEREGES